MTWGSIIDWPPSTGDRRLELMGIVNVTNDSFSDGGLFKDPDAAVRQGIALHAAGADYVDVGGESTKPGAHRVELAEELLRIEPVVKALSAEGIRVSIDTTRAVVADAALECGAVMVNDVSGGRADPNMARVVRNAHCPWVLTHSRGVSETMNSLACYDDVVTDVIAELKQRIDAALAAGIALDSLIADPGLGFAKRPEHNWALLGAVDRLRDEIGLPILLGASRKSFLGDVLADELGQPRPVKRREDATTAITAFAAAHRVWAVRVHEISASLDAARVMGAIARNVNIARTERHG